MTTLQQDLLEITQELKAFVEKHLQGKHNQKTHGSRYGAGQAKESLRRLKEDKTAREKYKTTARKKRESGKSKTISSSVNTSYNEAKQQVMNGKEYYTGNPAYAGGKILPEATTKESVKKEVKQKLETMGAAGMNKYSGKSTNRAITNNEAEQIAKDIGKKTGFNAAIYEAFGKSSKGQLTVNEISDVVYKELRQHNDKSKTERNIFGGQKQLTKDIF